MTIEVNAYWEDVIGIPLRQIQGRFYYRETEISAMPDSIWLIFAGQTIRHITGAPDGEHLCLDAAPPILDLSMGTYGRMVVRDLGRPLPFAECVGAILHAVWTLESPQGHVIGIRCDFGHEAKPIILNWGDELLLTYTYPEDAKGQEIIERRIVTDG
ncbi:MAG: hypothetical protein LZF86_110939 [Nitrospira sp.]|nr:MAG: hypothetical protein LZF86_110939 [Nitrospira sp.]